MLSRNDLILLLTDIEKLENIPVDNYVTELLTSSNIPLHVIKFINSKRQFDVASFYEMLRYNYNHKKSPLYKNLVKEEFTDPQEVLTTLSALNLQIMLYARKLEDSKLFLKHSRAEEITFVLNNYCKTYDLRPCLKLLGLIKSDLKVFEGVKNETISETI